MKYHTDHKKGWDTLRNTEDVRLLVADVITERHQECLKEHVGRKMREKMN